MDYEIADNIKIDLNNVMKTDLSNCSYDNSKLNDVSYLTGKKSNLKKKFENKNINIISLEFYQLNSQNVSSLRNFYTFLKDEISNIIEYLFYQNANVIAMVSKCNNNKQEYMLGLMFYLNK